MPSFWSKEKIAPCLDPLEQQSLFGIWIPMHCHVCSFQRLLLLLVMILMDVNNRFPYSLFAILALSTNQIGREMLD
jgi:hypothetical protein